eukprot:1351140-Amorphochlora_amoeboformis.AAC.2
MLLDRDTGLKPISLNLPRISAGAHTDRQNTHTHSHTNLASCRAIESKEGGVSKWKLTYVRSDKHLVDAEEKASIIACWPGEQEHGQLGPVEQTNTNNCTKATLATRGFDIYTCTYIIIHGAPGSENG